MPLQYSHFAFWLKLTNMHLIFYQYCAWILIIVQSFN